MSESHPVYVRCASGNNSHTDCVVLRYGSLVEILGHPLMQFAPEDAERLARAILSAIDNDDHGETDKTVDDLRSAIAKALHVPVMADSLTRPLLEECTAALRSLDRDVTYWRRECIAALALLDNEIDDGK